MTSRPYYRLWIEAAVAPDLPADLADPVFGPYEFTTRRGLDEWVRRNRARSGIVGTKVWHKGEIIELTGTFAAEAQA